MSLPKKGSRKINVENVTYLWIAKGNFEWINLTIAPSENGQKIKAIFDFDTEYKESNAFNNPFIITPYVTREVILFAIKNGYSPNGKPTEMNLGNLTKVLKLDLSGAKKTKKLIQSIEKRISSNKVNSTEKEQIQAILKDTKEFIQHGEWFVGFEIMVTNLYEIYFKIEKEELILMKEIFQKAKVDWKKDWAWIEELKEEN
jgi:hypothetical protein